MFWKFDRAKGRIDQDAVVRDRAAALHAGPRRRRQARQRRLRVHQLVQHRDGVGGGTMEGNPRSSPAPPRTTWTTSTSSTGGRPRSWSRPARPRRSAGMKVVMLPTAIERQGAHVRPRAQEPARRRRHPRRRGDRRRRQARHPRHRLRLRQDQGADRRRQVRGEGPVRRAGPRRSRTSIRGQVEIGLGPLHTQFDDKGNAYTSLFLESAVAKWSLDGAEARREAAGPLQHRPHRSRPRATR